MKKPARPAKPVRKTPAKPKHVVRHPQHHQHPQRHHRGRGSGAKGSSPAGGGGAAPAPRPHKPKAKKQPRRKLALAESVACCSAEALAASLRLAGWTVTDQDVLELYRLTASGPEEGATIADTLEAAQEFGLAGVRPVTIWNVDSSPVPGLILGVTLPGGPHALTLDASGAVWSWGDLYSPAQLRPRPAEEAWLVEWEV